MLVRRLRAGIIVAVLLAGAMLMNTALASMDEGLREALRYRLESITPDRMLVAGEYPALATTSVRPITTKIDSTCLHG